jgi:hypothetical protein
MNKKEIKIIAEKISTTVNEFLQNEDNIDIEDAYEDFGRDLIEELINSKHSKNLIGSFIDSYIAEQSDENFATGMVVGNRIWC